MEGIDRSSLTVAGASLARAVVHDGHGWLYGPHQDRIVRESRPARINQDRLCLGRHDQGRRAPHDINEVDVQRPRPGIIPTRRVRQDEQSSKSHTQPPPGKIHRCLLPDPRHSPHLERPVRPCRMSHGIEGRSRADRPQSQAHRQELTIPAGSRRGVERRDPDRGPTDRGSLLSRSQCPESPASTTLARCKVGLDMAKPPREMLSVLLRINVSGTDFGVQGCKKRPFSVPDTFVSEFCGRVRRKV